MNRRRTWTPLRWTPLTAAGAALAPAVGVAPTHAGVKHQQRQPSPWHTLNAEPSGGFRPETDLDDRLGNRLKHRNRQHVDGRTAAGAAIARNLCPPAVDHVKLLELASDIATARARRD
ncbi:hypothetical protein HC028_25975 [Planosporangium flavigriseum]|uniref:Uncharacterized protein n=1 Tax=Planosporangium flavigriseum TaxID=373681 RepID=A0A8J3LS96_9ACTN|nr:hypothetical protein [Planosporangium flavigriseum]NJC67927.1 hypothetical protein [Planosporangium flavigriseum]GIG76679.1 hypothetical protein Pfl04_50830 [Planosporangium flavigriseum]